MKDILLGIDIGTSGCKIVAFKPDGTVVAQKTESYLVLYPQKGWAEQNPENWWQAVCKGVCAVLEKGKIHPTDIAGIGVDGQSWSAIPVDREGNVLCNTPIWMDTRASAECTELLQEIPDYEIFALCGNPLRPSYTLPKILWFKKHRPDVYAKTDKILQSNSFINLRLTGVVSQDVSQGYGLHCFDMHHGKWDETMCARMGIKSSLLPPIFACDTVIGQVTDAAAAQTGLAAGTPVVAGGLDAACGTLGAGIIKAGQTQEQGGQAGGMSICLDEYHADKHLILGYHVVPGEWLLQGGTTGGGGVMNWMEREFGDIERLEGEETGKSSFRILDEKAAQVVPGSNGVVFPPYMSGERSPIWDTNARGVFFGLDFAKTKAHFFRAALEGTAYALKHNLDTAKVAGAPVDVLYATGGAANSRLWMQIKADVTGKKIAVPSSDTTTTLGAAILAGVGVGIYRDYDDAKEKTFCITRRYEPNPANTAVYEMGYHIYRTLYEQLKDLMKLSNRSE